VRTESELQSTRNRYYARCLSARDNGDQFILTILEWVLDSSVSDLELTRVMEQVNDHPGKHDECCPGDGSCVAVT
jgi:NAD-dependent dihydropyrimidine dehydrogenase PreA subunit